MLTEFRIIFKAIGTVGNYGCHAFFSSTFTIQIYKFKQIYEGTLHIFVECKF